jgi:hypothetical protein
MLLHLFVLQSYYEISYINVREYRRGNQKWTIERNWKHVQVTQDEEKQKHNTICVGATIRKQTQKPQIRHPRPHSTQPTGVKDEPNIIVMRYMCH